MVFCSFDPIYIDDLRFKNFFDFSGNIARLIIDVMALGKYSKKNTAIFFFWGYSPNALKGSLTRDF
jgi:hypothetical protein